MRSTPAIPEKLDGIAVDFGGTKIAVARLSSGVIVNHRRLETDTHANGDQQIRIIADAITSLNPLFDERIVIAASGRIDQQGRWFAINEDTLSNIQGIPLQQRLTDIFNRPVTVVNDAIAAAKGEACAGAGRDCERFAYVTVSTGVGGTCVLHGTPLTSSNGLAGSIGFMTSLRGRDRCGSGRLGTFESIASGKAIALAAERLGHADLSAEEVFEFCNSGAPWAVDLVRKSAAAIAELGTNLALVTGVTRLVVGGSVGLADGYCDLIAVAMRDEPELFQLDVTPAQLGQNSVLVGALAFESNFNAA